MLAAPVMLLLGAAAVSSASPHSLHVLNANLADTSEVVHYLGDPQIGFGRSGWHEDEARFAAAAHAASNATAVVIAGDLVNVWDNATLTGGFDAVWPKMFDRQRVHLIPGNHDVNSGGSSLSEFKSQLEHYHSTFGVDYHSFATKHATFVMVNSETLIAPYLGLKNQSTDPWLHNVSATQWSWLETTLEQAQKATSHTILVSHHPPFLKSPTEADVYWNWPISVRPRLLGLLAKYGVKVVLCGHTHTTTNRTVGGLSIFTVAGTARAFDHNGCGYQRLTINSTDIALKYIRQSDPQLKQCLPTLTHPDFDDAPQLSSSWAPVSWLLE